MKKAISIVLLLVCCLMLSGCVVAIGGGGGGKSDKGKEYRGCGENEAVFAEIDAVKRLTLESSRRDIYMEIAKRDNLTGEVRGYLADEATKRLTLESSRRDVLMALARNPSGQPKPHPEVNPVEDMEIKISE